MTDDSVALTVGIVSVPTTTFTREAGAAAAAGTTVAPGAAPAAGLAGGAEAVDGAAGAQATASTRTRSALPAAKRLDRRSLSRIVPTPALTRLRLPKRTLNTWCASQMHTMYL